VNERPRQNAYTPCNAEGCGRSPANGDVLYRVAPKGQIGPWACAEHVEAERHAWAEATPKETT
jgi:hypothetical protein